MQTKARSEKKCQRMVVYLTENSTLHSFALSSSHHLRTGYATNSTSSPRIFFRTIDSRRRLMSFAKQGTIHHYGVIFGDKFFAAAVVSKIGDSLPNSIMSCISTPGLLLNTMVCFIDFEFHL